MAELLPTDLGSMDGDTLEALRGSVAKWQAIVDGTGTDDGPDNCPLCRKFNRYVNPAAEFSCGGCPVAAAVNDYACDSTPYMDYTEAEENDDELAMKEAAQKELDFLKSLLPENVT